METAQPWRGGRREVVEGLATCGRGAGRGGEPISKEGVPLDPYLSSNFCMEYETHPNIFFLENHPFESHSTFVKKKQIALPHLKRMLLSQNSIFEAPQNEHGTNILYAILNYICLWKYVNGLSMDVNPMTSRP